MSAAPAATERRTGRLVGELGHPLGQRAGAGVVDHRDAAARASSHSSSIATSSTKPTRAEVRLVRAQDRAGVRPERRARSRRAGCGWWCPPPPGARPTARHVGNPERAADLHELPARDHHLAPLRQRGAASSTAAAQLFTTSAASAPVSSRQQRLHVRLARPALARVQVVLEVASSRGPARATAARGRVRERRAAEVGVDDHAGGVEHRGERAGGAAPRARRSADGAHDRPRRRRRGSLSRACAIAARAARHAGACGALRGRPRAPRPTAARAARSARPGALDPAVLATLDLLLPDRRLGLDPVDDLARARERLAAVRRGHRHRDARLRQRHLARRGAPPPPRTGRGARSPAAAIAAIRSSAISAYASYSSRSTSRVTPWKVTTAPARGSRTRAASASSDSGSPVDPRVRLGGRRRSPAGSAPARRPDRAPGPRRAYSRFTAITSGKPVGQLAERGERVAHARAVGQLEHHLARAGALAQHREQADRDLHGVHATPRATAGRAYPPLMATTPEHKPTIAPIVGPDDPRRFTDSGIEIKQPLHRGRRARRSSRSGWASRASTRSRAASTRTCTASGAGRCASTRATPAPRRPTSASTT